MVRTKRELMGPRMQGPRAIGSDADELLTLQDVAALLQVSPNTVYYWRYQRTGPKGHKVGRQVRYWRRDVMTWLQEREDVVSGLRPVRR